MGKGTTDDLNVPAEGQTFVQSAEEEISSFLGWRILKQLTSKKLPILSIAFSE
jgi:hypothetical protein